MAPKLPALQDYFVPTVEAFRQRGGSATISEHEDDVALLMGLTEEARAVPHGEGPQSQFQYVLGWVRTYLKKVGAIDNSSRGVWRLTDLGEHMANEEISTVPQKVRAVEAERRRRAAKVKGPAVSADPDDDSGDDWKSQLLEALIGMAPEAFERLCQRILREAGFVKVDVTARSGDGGIDGTGVLRVNLVSFQVIFQCKRWKGSVGAPVVRDFRGAMVGRADKGLILTTGAFTADARREAVRDGAPTIDLVDGDGLCDLLKDLKLGVSVHLVEEISVDAKWFGVV